MEQIQSERVNQEVITIEDLLDKYELKGETVAINNGKITE